MNHARARQVQITAATLLILVAIHPAFGAATAPVAPKEEKAEIPAVVLQRISHFDEKSKTGKDPFFPASARRGAPAASETNGVVKVEPVKLARPAELLILKGILGSTAKRFALVNSQIFSPGDEAYIRTTSGVIKVKCLEIRASSVVLSLDGGAETKELTLGQDGGGLSPEPSHK